MDKKDYFIVSIIIFILAGLLHLIRAVNGWDMVVGGFIIPLWLSWLVVIILAFMVWQGIKLRK